MGINQKQIRKLYHSTIAELELSTGNDKIITFCQESNNFFSYRSNYNQPRNGTTILNTGDGGTSRWVIVNDTSEFISSISILSGDGMDFTEIDGSSGTISLGIPSGITNTSINELSSTSHTHEFIASDFIAPDGGLYVTNDNQFHIDSNIIIDSIIPGLTTISGVTENTFLGTISSGITLGMVYIENLGTTTGYFNLGTTTTGNELNPFGDILVESGTTLSITVNRRLSKTETTQLYISSSDWSNIELIVQWAEITYKNQSNEIDPSSLPIATSDRLGGVKIGNNINVSGDGTISIDNPVVSLVELSDTSISNPQQDQVLTYSGGTWVNGTAITNLSDLSDTSINSPEQDQTLIYSGGTWVNGVSTTGGGFKGTVDQLSSEPSNLKTDDWVQPKPNSDGTYNYTFTNFKDSLGVGINVNLSLENVKLRYVSGSPGYWIKESFRKPLGESKTWIGDTNDQVEEVSVIDEWVSDESSLVYTGQKYAYDTQSIFVTDVGPTLTTIQNYLFVQGVDLNTAGNTTLLTIPTGKKLVVNSIKLIMNNTTANSFTINIGNNSSTYNNIINSASYSNVNTNDIFDMDIYVTTAKKSIVLQSISGSSLILRVTSTPSATLTADVLIEGFIY